MRVRPPLGQGRPDRPIEKPWRVITDYFPLSQAISRTRAGDHEDAPCQGRDTKLPGLYTLRLSVGVVKSFIEGGPCPAGPTLEALPAHVGRQEAEQEPAESTLALRRAVEKLRTDFGHLGSRNLARAVRLSGGSDAATNAALHYRCPVCERVPAPANPAHLPGSILRAQDFNESVAIGMFELADTRQRRQLFLNIDDRARGFQIVAPCDSKHPCCMLQRLDHGGLDGLGRHAQRDHR